MRTNYRSVSGVCLWCIVSGWISLSRRNSEDSKMLVTWNWDSILNNIGVPKSVLFRKILKVDFQYTLKNLTKRHNYRNIDALIIPYLANVNWVATSKSPHRCESENMLFLKFWLPRKIKNHNPFFVKFRAEDFLLLYTTEIGTF